ncbi:hypothetical protein ACTRW9_08470 [Nitrospina sp. 32_T5]|uniref:anti-sigma factor family protein n=1 Tax=unclassified Nitrospina TaxID=2638683 RepID=UPI003F98D266
MRFMKLRCEDTSPLISEMMDHTLPLPKRLRVALHLSLCRMCRAYQRQLNTVRVLARGLGREDTPLGPQVTMSDDCRESLKAALKKHQGL